MPRHVLIIDAIATNRIVLKVQLAAAFYDVEQAGSAAEGLEFARNRPPAMIILGTLNDMAIAEFCKAIKSQSQTRFCPIICVSADEAHSARLGILQAGVDDIVRKPCDDATLLARLRSLQRARDMDAELQLRENTRRALGLAEARAAEFEHEGGITIVSNDRADLLSRLRELRSKLPHQIELCDPRSFLRLNPEARARKQPHDAFLLVLQDGAGDADLQILAELRTREETRHAAVMVLVPEGQRKVFANALDLGANDVVKSDIATEELAFRLDRLVRRKHKADKLRNTVRDGLRAAVTDPLTGLHNRRFAMPHLGRVAERARRIDRPFAVMVADLDHFKRINDTYGHAAGDEVLSEVARRLQANLRPMDLVARIGGEEFLIALPDVPGRVAQRTAHRICKAISDQPFKISSQATPIAVTISIGITTERAGAQNAPDTRIPALTPEVLLRRADQALYGAKSHGRNQVELSRPAA